MMSDVFPYPARSIPTGFKIVPRIALSPDSGTGATLVSVSGSGFRGGFGFAPVRHFRLHLRH